MVKFVSKNSKINFLCDLEIESTGRLTRRIRVNLHRIKAANMPFGAYENLKSSTNLNNETNNAFSEIYFSVISIHILFRK